MRNALNIYKQHLELFSKIASPLACFSDMSFGYMKVFNDGYYYSIIEDGECLRNFANNVNSSCIFCERNITDYHDDEYYFTLWPKMPSNIAMEIYFKHDYWDGVTISKVSEEYAELYWFTGKTSGSNIQKFCMKNKHVLLKFIDHFNESKHLLIPSDSREDLFKFNHGFNFNLPTSERINDTHAVIEFLKELNSQQYSNLKRNLSHREIEVLSIISQGFTSKIAAQRLGISIKTIQNHIEHIKKKTDTHFKSDLISLYRKSFSFSY